MHASAEGLRGIPLEDAELSETWGQALLTLTNTSVNDLDFTRITLAADIRLNANFGNMRLGEYTYSANNGTGADIDISQLNFGGAGSVASKSTVLITDPYMEFVYRNVGDATTREVVGMRLGCLNHALLSAEAIRARGLTLAGWVANHIDAVMPYADENVQTLAQRLNAPLLARIAYAAQGAPRPALVAAQFELDKLA